MRTPTSRHCPAPAALAAASLLASASLLSGCGGGGGSADSMPAPAPASPPAPSAVTITGKAVDGALSGATACYDLNDNGACDSGEPAATTAADGGFSLAVMPADVGKHRLVVSVPASAVDADTGAAVGTAFTLQSPASGTTTAHSVFVSPLTTAVQGHVDATGATVAEASALVQAQTGLAVSPLTDFTAANSGDNKQAALVARLLQATALAQADALKDVVGKADLSGGTASAVEVQKQISAAVFGALATIAGKAAEPGIANASGASLATALSDAAKAVVTQVGLSADEARAAIGVAKMAPDTAVVTPAASAQLGALSYTDVNNWFMRSLQASAADNTPDAAGMLRYGSVYMQSQSSGYSATGVMQAWANGSSFARRGDMHWNGSAWVACKLGDRNTASVRDAMGRSSYNYCDGLEKGRTVRTSIELSGQSVASVFTDKIRSFPGGANGVSYANWGPKDLSLFGTTTFSSGAKLQYQTNTVTETAMAYDVQPSNGVTGVAVAIAAGGDARQSPAPACAGVTSASVKPINTLDDLIAQNPGQPCIFAKFGSGNDLSLDPYEQWGTSTASLGVLSAAATKPAGTGNFYNADLRLRVAFAGGGSKAARYYRCLSRASNTSASNCSLIGSGTYTIQTLGDARVMSFSALPALMQKAGYSRIFVERGGKLYYGYQSPVGASTNYLRLNRDAANTVLAALPGMPTINPTTRYADLTAASQAAMTTAKGVWFGQAADGSEFTVLRIGDGGRYLAGQMGPARNHEQTGHELGWLDYDASSQTFRALTESNSSGARGLMLRSAAEQASEKLTITAAQLSTSLGSMLARISNDPQGIVGLWALGSATEFNTQHFLFLPNGRVLMIDPLGDTEPGPCLAARQGPAGGEYASYVWDKAAGTLSVSSKVYDTNGCAGLFDSSPGAVGTPQASGASFAVTLSADGQTAHVAGVDGTATLYRVAPQ